MSLLSFQRHIRRACVVALLLVTLCQTSSLSLAQQPGKPYDQQLYRLSEILGAVHYLRELCASKDGQKWRDSMQVLIDAEGSTAARKAKLTRQFNRGYRGYSRTYRSCTGQAKKIIDRFIKESIEITDELIKLAQ